MRRLEAIDRIARAIACMEGFYLTQQECEQRGIQYPPLARRLCNPGNIRLWRSSGGVNYPRSKGYVDFRAWAALRMPGATLEDIEKAALDEGWRVLRVIVSQYIDGKYTNGKPPSLMEMFRVYAPASDNNYPEKYAQFVAQRTGLDVNKPIVDQLEG